MLFGMLLGPTLVDLRGLLFFALRFTHHRSICTLVRQREHALACDHVHMPTCWSPHYTRSCATAYACHTQVLQEYATYAEGMQQRWYQVDERWPGVRAMIKPALNLFHGEKGSKK
jgi:hypothetical protein